VTSTFSAAPPVAVPSTSAGQDGAASQDSRLLAHALRVLAMDAVEVARSGHPGAPLGLADAASVLWGEFLRHNPADPAWPDRDRFVLSNGHASMLLYGLLHLTGYDLSIDDLQAFRQLHSRTPGHPEYGRTPGVEMSTGPLAQGLAAAVGMALAERLLAERFNRDGHVIVDHRTYAIVGDGCLMEGLSHEACSLAGTWRLGKLIVLYDDNGISIDGPVSGWMNDDTAMRFAAYGWHVVADVDGHDAQAIRVALQEAIADPRPSLIDLKTVIAYGAPLKAGTAGSHGAPLGAEEVRGVREALGWPHEPFVVPQWILQTWDARPAGLAAQAEWQARMQAHAAAFPELAAEFQRRMDQRLPEEYETALETALDQARQDHRPVATRKASRLALETVAPALPELIGGSADLSESNGTQWTGSHAISEPGQPANYIHYGVREFGMAMISLGMARHGGFIPYAGTFLVFSDYCRSAVRTAAMMGRQVIFVLTHDSIAVGEDGPTHQPVEHLAALRLIPNLDVWRPADRLETVVAWQMALEQTLRPSCLILSRQDCRCVAPDEVDLTALRRGGYILEPPADGAEPRLVLMATGSEVALALDAAAMLRQQGVAVQVVSMPCTQVFDRQSVSYRNMVLPPGVPRLVIEAASSAPWYRYVGGRGDVMGIDCFGESGTGVAVLAHFGFTMDHVLQRAQALLGAGG
jgi:transketolase